MDLRKMFLIFMLCYVNNLSARAVQQQKAIKLKSVQTWIVRIKLGCKKVCTGIQLSDAWILTLADCIDKKNELTKYNVVLRGGSRYNIIAAERREEFILLKTKPKKKFEISDSLSTPSNYDFWLFMDNSGYVNKESTQAVPLLEGANSKSVQNWIVKIKLGDKIICTGVQLSVTWILTHADCILKRKHLYLLIHTVLPAPSMADCCSDGRYIQFYVCYSKLTKYSVVLKDGSEQEILDEERGKTFILLKTKAKRKTYVKLSDSLSPPSNYEFWLYYMDKSGKETANDVDFVSSSSCKKEGIDDIFNKKHKCFKVNVKRNSNCLQGSLIFGSKKEEIILQGLSTASSDSCASTLQTMASIQPYLNWINTFLIDCGPLQKLQNGKATLDKESTTTVGATASIICNSGYDADRKKITCLNTGEWEKATCTIKDCGSAEVIKNGKITLDKKSKSTVGATATVKCNSGYTTQKEKIVCLKSGKWEKSSCKIKDCGSAEAIKNGKITLDKKSKSTVGATATVKCNSGYTAQKEKIVCLKTGKWEKSSCIIKDCGSPEAIKNGKINLDKKSKSTVGATATVRCNSGYTAQRKKIVCLKTGKWEKSSCNIKDCGAAEVIKNGKITLDKKSKSTVGATATVRCNSGYTAQKGKIVCLKTGKWEKSSCRIKDCGQNAVIDMASSIVYANTTTVGSIATFVCKEGFQSNSSFIRCLESGSWENATCTIKVTCCASVLVTEGKSDCGKTAKIDMSSSIVYTNTTTFGSIATFVCNEGYESNASSVRCLESGSWEIATCTIKDCGQNAVIDMASSIVYANTTTIGSIATFVCKEGFMSNSSFISCLVSGSWENATCIIKDCGRTAIIDMASSIVYANTTTFGSIATFICNKGYESNSSSVRCLESGSWENATCTIKDCGQTAIIDMSSIVYANTTTVGSIATFVCNDGYESNSSFVRCIDTGSWENATCTIKDCGQTAIIDMSSSIVYANTTTFGSIATFVCNKGYESNSSSIRCLESGSWENATCTIKDCGQTAIIDMSSSIVYANTTTFGSNATFVCNEGYESNSSSVRCLESGSWENATCTIKDCGKTTIIDMSSIVYANTTTVGSYATVVCNKGYESNSSSIRCLESGSWENATCTIKDCGKTAKIDNSSSIVYANTTTFGSIATFVCKDGYASILSSIKCLGSGSWENATCLKDCGQTVNMNKLSDVLYNYTMVGSTAFFDCLKGYRSTNSPVRCLESGSWETPNCTIIDCGTLWGSNRFTLVRLGIEGKDTTYNAEYWHQSKGCTVTCKIFGWDASTVDCLA